MQKQNPQYCPRFKAVNRSKSDFRHALLISQTVVNQTVNSVGTYACSYDATDIVPYTWYLPKETFRLEIEQFMYEGYTSGHTHMQDLVFMVVFT